MATRKARASIEESLRKLKTDCIERMLIYQPFGNCCGAYSNIDPNKTVEIVNCVYDHAAEGMESAAIAIPPPSPSGASMVRNNMLGLHNP